MTTGRINQVAVGTTVGWRLGGQPVGCHLTVLARGAAIASHTIAQPSLANPPQRNHQLETGAGHIQATSLPSRCSQSQKDRQGDTQTRLHSLVKQRKPTTPDQREPPCRAAEQTQTDRSSHSNAVCTDEPLQAFSTAPVASSKARIRLVENKAWTRVPTIVGKHGGESILVATHADFYLCNFLC